jgi:tRNA pseudouridine38-40 synthase
MQRYTYRVTIAYRGAAFWGFAKQPGHETVESVLIEALSSLDVPLTRVGVGGRTDRGVNATGQVISFWSRDPLDEREIVEVIDRARPDDLAALEARWVPRRFHAQHSAQMRRYVYLFEDGASLDVSRIDRMLLLLSGRRSFRAYARDTLPDESCVRRLFEARARRIGSDSGAIIRFDFAGDGFLRRQVRVIVATAIREAERGANEDALVRIAESEDRGESAPPAAPEGLYLAAIGYEPVISFSRRGQLERPPLSPRR